MKRFITFDEAIDKIELGENPKKVLKKVNKEEKESVVAYIKATGADEI